MQDSEKQTELEWLASDRAGCVVSGRRKRTERPGAATAATTAATAVSASNRGISSSVGSLPWLPTCQLDEFCLGAVEHPSTRTQPPRSPAVGWAKQHSQRGTYMEVSTDSQGPFGQYGVFGTSGLRGVAQRHAVQHLPEVFRLEQGGDQRHRHRTDNGK